MLLLGPLFLLQEVLLRHNKVGAHDKLGIQVVPLKVLTAHETTEFTLDLLKFTNIYVLKIRRKEGKLW